MSWRRLKMLVRQLPMESRLARATNPAAAWTTTDYLLAALIDTTRNGNWQRSGGKGPKPKPIPRPADTRHERFGKPVPLEEARGLLDRWKRGELSTTHRRTTKERRVTDGSRAR